MQYKVYNAPPFPTIPTNGLRRYYGIVAFRLALARWAALVLLIAQSAAGGEVALQAFFGHDGAVSPNRWNPLTIRVTNVGDTFEGAIVARTLVETGAGGVETVYAVRHPLRLAADASETIRFALPVGRTALPVSLRVLSDRETILRTEITTPWNPGPFVVGITDDQPVDAAGVRIAYPLVETLPDHPAAYDSAEALLMGNPDLTRAGSAQIAALRSRLETYTSLRLPVVVHGLEETTVSRVLFADPIYRYPPRWIVAPALLAYLATMASLSRLSTPAALGVVPLLFATVIVVVFGAVDTPPRTAMAEVQRIRAIGGETGAIVTREIRVMSVDARDIPLRVPPGAVPVPESGKTLAADAGPTGSVVRVRVEPWTANVISFAERAANPLVVERSGSRVTVRNAGNHVLRDVAYVGRSSVIPMGTLRPGEVKELGADAPPLGPVAAELYRELRRDETMPEASLVALGNALVPPVESEDPLDRVVHRAVVIAELGEDPGP